jgi:hypothetical protein
VSCRVCDTDVEALTAEPIISDGRWGFPSPDIEGVEPEPECWPVDDALTPDLEGPQ